MQFRPVPRPGAVSPAMSIGLGDGSRAEQRDAAMRLTFARLGVAHVVSPASCAHVDQHSSQLILARIAT